ncbi:MAG: HAMP domain-containing protein [Fibrobacteria bacterium]|nr:HAMP domain-containing protein [Fibrobacteria bacterium]
MNILPRSSGRTLAGRVSSIASVAIVATLLVASLVAIRAFTANAHAAGAREEAAMERNLAQKGRLLSNLLAHISVDAVLSRDAGMLALFAEEATSDSDVVAVRFLGKDGGILAVKTRGDTVDGTLAFEEEVVTDPERHGISKTMGKVVVLIGRERLSKLSRELEVELASERKMAWIGSILIACFAAVALVLTLRWVLGRRVTRPLTEALDLVKAISLGDLGREIHLRSDDELGRLADALREMNSYLREMADQAGRIAAGDLSKVVKPRSDEDSLGRSFASMTENLRRSMETLLDTSRDISGTAATLQVAGRKLLEEASGVSSTAGSVSSSADSVSERVRSVAVGAEEMSATIQEIARSAEGARATSRDAMVLAQEASGRVQDLSNSSLEISRVIEVIFEISEQTKLLALNATIEAARAGEAGKGFAVVASEVKELAKSTAEASEDIRTRIQQMQQTTGSTVEDMQKVREVVERIEGAITEIAGAMEQQSATTSEIVGNVGESSRLVEEISREVQGVAASSLRAESGASGVLGTVSRMTEVGDRLQEVAQRFRV